MGTQRNVGKTTLAIGLLHSLRGMGLRVGYTKPLGQRIASEHGHVLHDDARIVASVLGEKEDDQPDMAVPLPSGRVEKEVFDLHTDELLGKVKDAFSILRRDHDVVIVEAMGHVAMGSCLGLSAADVCRALDAKALLVSGGGIGRAIDDISLCSTFVTSRGGDFLGVVVNKVYPEKFTRIKEATKRGLENLGIESYGTVPYEEELTFPTMEQVHAVIGGEVVAGSGNMQGHVKSTIVAAMESAHMVRYLTHSTLIFTPGDRTDNILAALSAQVLGSDSAPALAGIVLTGGFRPDGTVMRLVSDSNVPVIMVKDDTYTAASKFRQTVFKITPNDHEKIDMAVCMVADYVNVDRIVEALED
jgi:BioD-like phosphotransacetylase family protein